MASWQIFSIGLYISSVLMYLLIRYLKAHTDSRLINYFMFLPGTFILYTFSELVNNDLSMRWVDLLILFFVSLVFSFLGNTFSLKALEKAPNPGYSLIIQKSYAAYTIFASYFLFGLELNIQKVIAVFIIIFFLALVILEKKKKEKNSKNKNLEWIIYSFVSFFFFGGIWLNSRAMTDQGYTSLTITFYTFLFNVIIQSIINYKHTVVCLTKLNLKILAILFLIGIFSISFNLFTRIAVETAPNVAYVNIVNASSISAITILSAIIFKDELNLQKVIGVVGVTLGIIYMMFV